jgi:hypothetical protein
MAVLSREEYGGSGRKQKEEDRIQKTGDRSRRTAINDKIPIPNVK